MSHQNNGAFGHAQVTSLDTEPEKKVEDDDFPQSLVEALLGE